MVRFLTIFFSLFVASPVQAAPAARAVMENIPTKSSVNASGFFGPLVGNVTGNLTGNADTATSATSVSAGGVNLSTVTTRFQLVEASTGNLYATKLASGTAIPSSLVNLSTVAAKITPTLTGPVTIVAPPAQYGLEMNGDVRLSSSMVTVGAGNISIGGSGAFIGPLTGNAATVTTNANLTGPITSVGNATTIAGPVPTATVDLSTVTTALNLKAPIASPAFTGNVSGPSSATFNAFFGDGSALTNITATDSSKVAKAGDTMTGELIMNLSAGTTGLSVLTAFGVNVKGTGVAIRARSDGKALVIKNAADTQESIVLNGNGVTLLTGFSMPSGGDGGNMTLGVPANFNAGLSGTTGSFSGSVTAGSMTALSGGMKVSTIGDKVTFDNPRRAIFVDPAGANPVTITNHAAAGKIVQFSLDYDDSNADAGMNAVAYVDGTGVVSNYGIVASTVGIGTNSPGTKLHMSSGTHLVDGNQSGDVLTVRSNLSNADLHFLLETTGTGGSESSRIDLKTTNRHWLIQNAKGLSNGFAIRDETAGSATRLFIDDAGKVGIGTTAPATTLDVNGNAQFGSGAAKSTFTAAGFWEPISKTKAQIDLLVPTKVGQVIYASDTTLPGLCVSTGTLAAQWRKMESATLGCGTNN